MNKSYIYTEDHKALEHGKLKFHELSKSFSLEANL